MRAIRLISIFFIATILIFTTFGVLLAKPSQQQPNVLFIIVDTLRDDHLGCYGYDKIKTPNIDAIAKQGTLFKNAISQVPLTFPSHSSMFTSTYPQFNKMRDNSGYKLDNSNITLAERLKENGYATAAFISTMVLKSKSGINQGFDTFDDKIEKSVGKRVLKFMDDERTADKTTAAALNWLKANKDKKFFLWVHYYDPHTIYNPPSPYKDIYKDSLYDGEIAFTDENIGVLISALKDLKLDKNTLIVFASDHGESLGEHEERGHAVFIYDVTLKVPLIFSYPGFIPQGKTVEEEARLIDVMPTILDILGIKKNKEIQGLSLENLINGKQKTGNLPAYSESLYAKFHFNWSSLQAIRTKDWKYIKSTEPELYNLKDDPKELNNLASSRKDIARDLDKQLESFLKKTSAPEEKEKRVEIDRETKEKLMSLGYVSGTITTKDGGPVPIKMIQIMEKLNIADRQVNAGLIDKAMQAYNEILASDPNNMEASLHLAQCYREMGKFDDAIKYFKRAASSKPDDPEVHDGLGNIYKSMGRVELAFKEFDIANKLDPDNPAVINNLGWCYQQKLDFDKAIEFYRKALALDPSLATTHANLAICYRVKKQLDMAIKEVETALKLEPELAFAHSELCACVAIQGRLDEAIVHCKKAIELDPEGDDGYINLGVCLERKGEFDKALENYRKVLEISPWDESVYVNIGNVYAQKKDFDMAMQNFKKALEMNPKNLRAAAAIKALSQKKNR